MTNKKTILFIINPKSGNKTAKNVIDLIPKHLNVDKYDWSYSYTKYAKHATLLAAEAVNNKIDIVVAVGGDGMVNEVFQSLLNSETAFSIIPKGSGNGVARSFGIPINTISAIKNLNQATFIEVDSCQFNGHPFLGVAGIGFDGTISALFANKHTRGLKTYIKLIVSQLLAYKPHTYLLSIDNNEFKREAYVIAFANTQQYGNNAIIAPNAKFDDGKLNIVVVNSFSKWLVPILFFRFMTNSIHHSKYVETFEADGISLTTNEKNAHIDGEPITSKTVNVITVSPKSLKVYL